MITTQQSYSAGELSPSLYARFDIEKWHLGLAKALNAVVMPQGGIQNRTGFLHDTVLNSSILENAITGAIIKLLPWVYSTTDSGLMAFSYIPELDGAAHKLYLTVGYGGELYPVSDADDSTELSNYFLDSTDDAIEDVQDALRKFRYIQREDVLYLVNGDKPEIKITRTFTDDGTPKPKWTISNVEHKIDGVAPGSMGATEAGIGVQAYAVNGSGTGDENIQGLGKPTAYAASVVFTDGKESEITVAAGVNDFSSSPSIVDGVTSWDSSDWPKDSYIDILIPPPGVNELSAPGLISKDTKIPGDTDGHTYGDIDYYVVYKDIDGYYGRIAYASPKSGTTSIVKNTGSGAEKVNVNFVGEVRDNNIHPDDSDGPRVERDPFSKYGNPNSLSIFQQRKVYGGTQSKPQTLFTSKTSGLEDMSVSNPLKADDAITATMDSNDVNIIRHLVPSRDLLVFTSHGTWTFGAGANSDAITPANHFFKRNNSIGTSHIRPVEVEGAVLAYVPNNKSLVQHAYDISSDSYSPIDASLTASHLFDYDRAVTMAFQRSSSVVWTVMESGDMLSFTYIRAQKVAAWAKHNTDGKFEDVVVIPTDSRDLVYALVNRSNGRNVELLTERAPDGEVETCVFLDAAFAKYYPDGSGTELSGLEWLAGRTVTALLDGGVEEGIEVSSSGSLTLPYSANNVVIGLPYTTELETLPLFDRTADGFPNLKSVYKVTPFVWGTRGIEVSAGAAWEEPAWRSNEEPNAPTEAFSGKFDIFVPRNWGREGQIKIRQRYPLPFTLLSHSAHFSREDGDARGD